MATKLPHTRSRLSRGMKVWPRDNGGLPALPIIGTQVTRLSYYVEYEQCLSHTCQSRQPEFQCAAHGVTRMVEGIIDCGKVHFRWHFNISFQFGCNPL
jgi:hypothetical protein